MKKIIQIPGAPAPIGPYSQAVLQDNTLYVSGQIPMDPISGKLVNDSIENSCRQVLKNIGQLLTEAGMDYSNVVKCSIFLTDLSDFSTVNGVYADFFKLNPPARETVQVSRLPMDVSIEISCIALK